jgi:hypothetical protein
MNKHRMNQKLSSFAVRLRELVSVGDDVRRLHLVGGKNEPPRVGSSEKGFDVLALELFSLQFENNAAYRKICQARLPRRSVAKAGGLTPQIVEHWTQIPAVPASAFKELELSCIPPDERAAVFHSSGTTEQKPSRHFHNATSLEIYETSLWSWFAQNVLPDLRFTIHDLRLICLSPPPEQAPHSSLVHMFETVRNKLGAEFGVPSSGGRVNAELQTRSANNPLVFLGMIDRDGSWTLDFDAVLAALTPRAPRPAPHALLLLGTAFSFVHLLDFLAEKNLRFDLPAGSRVMETGGYKNRSRSMPKAELHALITERLGVPPENILCEYGMSELSSQAYDTSCLTPHASRLFYFPPWARVQIISSETGREVADGETGLIRVFDLANVFSVMAIQTEDLGVRRGNGFELIGRAQLAEPRGCSLMMDEPLSPPGGERVAKGRVRG